MFINVPPGRVGICISGGLDSALLYHLILKENKHVIPLLVYKNDDQQQHARSVISYLHKLHNVKVEPILLNNRDIRLAIDEAIKSGFRTVYVGVIKELEEFLVGWEPNNFKNSKWVRGPFREFDKRQIVDLVVKNNVEELFCITHSCATQGQGRCLVCNRCREREWGFSQLGLTDPGIM